MTRDVLSICSFLVNLSRDSDYLLSKDNLLPCSTPPLLIIFTLLYFIYSRDYPASTNYSTWSLDIFYMRITDFSGFQSRDGCQSMNKTFCGNRGGSFETNLMGSNENSRR
jgi:hypothetical protein